ncbi:unnamed protein product [Moneuplotes crassus]|uniref:Uncharacterized protein n=1 Tax=Euplotes crassus TaxID=5936 RepID=A0AAD1Y625_EUPCR|nr:unnamed protein product [Moneuplotes crassus]
MGCEVPDWIIDNLVKNLDYHNEELCDRVIRSYQFDFSRNIKNGPSFEEQVCKNNLNDLGVFNEVPCIYSPETAHIMINEFKKFMAINATLIAIKDDNAFSGDQTKLQKEFINGVNYYRSELVAPLHIDRIWKMLILHSQTYFEYCIELCGGYIDRIEPDIHNDAEISQKLDQTYKKFWEFHDAIETYPYFEKFPNPFNMDFKSNTDFYKYGCYDKAVTLSGPTSIFTLTENIDKLFDELDANNMTKPLAIILADKIDAMITCDYEITEEMFKIDCKDENTQILFEELLQLHFPEKVLQNFKFYCSLSDEVSMAIYLYYLKYLVIATLNDYNVSPSYWVDQLWHAHMGHTKHYRDTCLFIKDFVETRMSHLGISPREFIAHEPGDDTSETKQRLAEKENFTQQLYEIHFGDSPESNFILEYPSSPPETMTVNIIGLLTTRYLRKDPLSPLNELNQSITHDSSYLKSFLTKYLTKTLPAPDSYDFDNCDLNHQIIRFRTRMEKYSSLAGIGQQGWRKRYPDDRFEWSSEEGRGLGKEFGVEDEQMVFSPKGMIFISNIHSPITNLILVRRFPLPDISMSSSCKGLSYTLANLADGIQSNIDIWPLNISRYGKSMRLYSAKRRAFG